MTMHRTPKRRTRRHKKTRSHKGGGFFDSINPFASNDTTLTQSSGLEDPSMFSNAFSSVTDATKNAVSGTESYLQGVKNQSGSWLSGVKNKSTGMFSGLFSSDVPNTPVPSTPVPVNYGGRRRRRSRTMKGGLGLTYYATPVSNMKVAEPTSWQFYANGTNQYSVKGGTRKRRHYKQKRLKKK